MLDNETLPRVSEVRHTRKLAREFPAAPVVPNAEIAATTESSAPPKSGEALSTPRTVVDDEALEKALGQLNDHVQNLQRSLHFSVDKESGRTIVKVVDWETKEVIRQIPSEELLAIANRLRSAAGVLLADKV